MGKWSQAVNRQVSTWTEAIMTYFKVLSQYLSAKTNQNWLKSQPGQLVTQLKLKHIIPLTYSSYTNLHEEGQVSQTI